MATKHRKDRLQEAVADAVQRLQTQPERPNDWPPGPSAGDLYVFSSPIPASIEWLVVRPHLDDPSLILMAPADDFPLVGQSDVPLEAEFIDRPLTVRCGESTWIPATACREDLRVGFIPDEAVSLVRKKLAGLARGSLTEEPGAIQIEADPEYISWMQTLALAREDIERRIDVSPSESGTVLPFLLFKPQPLFEFAQQSQMALAADPASPLLAALAESLTSETHRLSPTDLITVLSVAGGERLWRTNPVLCIDRLLNEWDRYFVSRTATPRLLVNLLSTLIQKKIRLPKAALNRWAEERRIPISAITDLEAESPEPRIIGLAVDGTDGYVFPLRPTPELAGWRIDADLPFSGDQIQDGIAELLNQCGMPNHGAIPERLAFSFTNQTGRTARGESMTVAAILAVLDLLGKHVSPLFRAAVALVKLQSGGELGNVSNVTLKLESARRECGELSLIICSPESEIASTPGEVVWRVKSLADLAKRLHDARILSSLLDVVGPLTRAEAARVLDRLRCLVLNEHRYRDAADLGERVRKCGFADVPDPNLTVEFARLYSQACRHHGRFEEAVSVGREAYERVVDLADLACDDEEADAAAEYAAGLFSGHRFDDIPPLLGLWAEAVSRYPRRFRAQTRVKVWNTLGRALAILRQDGWDTMFGHSLKLHRTLGDVENIHRTTHYRVHALLRHGDIDGAKAALDEAPGLSEQATYGNPWAAFLHAEIARLEDRKWADRKLDERLQLREKPYAAWRYVQATARQTCRGRADAIARLQLAVELLRHEADGVERNICNLFATFLELNMAARSEDEVRWSGASMRAQNFLLGTSDQFAYYSRIIDALPSSPNLVFAEALLDRTPYF